MAELWRVRDDHPAAPGHVVRQLLGGRLVFTACGWAPTEPGKFIDRTELIASHRYACVFCLGQALAAAPTGRAVDEFLAHPETGVVLARRDRNNRGGRS